MLRRYAATISGKIHVVEVEPLEGSRVRVVIDGRERSLEVRPGGGALTWLDGTRVVEAFVDGALPKPTVTVRGTPIPVELADARSQALAEVVRERPRAAGPVSVRAPIPGRVAKLLVKAGDVVTAGRGLAVLEAMKMENEIRAPRDGVVREVRVAEGAAVDANQDLVILE